MNGKPGEHPLSDILLRGREVYGKEADDLIRLIDELSSRHEMHEWWTTEIGSTTDREVVLQKAEARYRELAQRSQQSGWGAR